MPFIVLIGKIESAFYISLTKIEIFEDCCSIVIPNSFLLLRLENYRPGESSIFDVGSFVAAAAWSDNLQLNIIALRNNSIVYNETITLDVSTPLLVTLDWKGIHVLMFDSTGGTHHDDLSHWGPAFVMDDLCVFV
jgi:hypothetical protein